MMIPSILLSVVVELFTSQGCSSCPPADELLRKLDRDPNVIAIAYHVDYWDTVSWRDPFAMPRWSRRQADYVRAMHLSTAYTPQVVVNGSRQLVGSNEPALRTALRDAPQLDARVSVTIENGTAVVVTNAARAGLTLEVVTVSNTATTKVEGGENDGRTIVNAAIARGIRTFENVPAGTQTFRVPLRGDRVVALLTDSATKRIVGAAAARH